MNLYQYQKLTESFCKLRSTCFEHDGWGGKILTDIHGMRWDERVICKVLAYDRTNGLIHVENPNGLKWISDLKQMELEVAHDTN